MRVSLIVVCIYGMVIGACRYTGLVVFHARLMVEWLQKNTGKLMCRSDKDGSVGERW